MTRRTLLAAPLGAAFAAPPHPDVKMHRKPRELAKDATTHDWTAFLGPAHNATSSETRLSRKLPPPVVWELRKGNGYASPAILHDHLVYLHRNGDREVIECLHPETAEQFWQVTYETSYEDRYGYNNGPRCSPVIDGDRVYTMGAQGVLHCIALDGGKVLWKRNVNADYKVRQDFFGTASTPLLEGGLLMINPGAAGGPCVVALDKMTGKEAWRLAHKDWGPSYASPVPATVHGKRRVFIFAGGESDPPTGGLLSIDPASGKLDFAFPWRSRSYESVNASCPVVFDNKVFVSASYRTGGVLLEIQPDMTPKQLWTSPAFGMHFMTPIYRDGHLYGYDGRNEPDASLACMNVASGQVVWRETAEWTETIAVNGQQMQRSMSPYRGTLLAADGAFLALGEMGHLLWLDLSPKGYKQISRAWLFAAPQTWALPVLSRGLLYVSQNTRDTLHNTPPRLICYDLRA